MSTARKILSNTLAQFIGKVLIGLLGLAVVKIATNYLTVESYGEYILIYEFLAFFGIAADLGLFTIGIKEMAEDEKNIPKIIGNILSLRTILVTLTMLAAIITVFLMPSYADTKIPIGVTIASLTVFTTIINGTITSVLQTKLKMHLSSIANVFGKIISVGFMAYIVFYGFPTDTTTGFFMLIAAGIIGNFVMLFSTYYWVRKITPLEYRFDLYIWKDVLIKSVPYGLALLLSTVYFRIDSILISFIRGQEEVGIYGVAMRMLEQLTVLPLFFMNSVLPILAKKLKEKSEDYKRVIRYSFDFLAAISIPMAVGSVILAYPIIFIISAPGFLSRISEGFYGSDIALQILVFAMLFQFLSVLFSYILIAINKQSRLLYINAIGVVFNIIANLIFIPIYGFRAAAVASVLSQLLMLISTYIVARHYIEFSISIKNTLKIIFSSLVMGAAIYYLEPISHSLLQNWGILLLIPLGMGIYTAMLFLTKTVDKNMLKVLKKSEEGIQSS